MFYSLSGGTVIADMSTANGNGFRTLEYYRERYNERVISPTELTQGDKFPLLFRVMHAPKGHGAYELLVELDDVQQAETIGVYAVRFTITTPHTGTSFADGEWFDGVWNPVEPITYRGKMHGKPANNQMVDAIVYQQSTPFFPEHTVVVEKDLELTGV